jgi:diguanylate cyclase (GGDEF)-like protein
MNLLLAREKVEELIAARKPRLIGTTADDGVLNPHLASLAQLQEGLIVPLVHEGRAEGLMSLYYRHPTGLQQQELERIAQLGNTLARSIANTNAHEQVQKMATTDSLTGLRNRRSFNEQMAREMRRAQRYKQHFGLIMIDIDHFKIYNDTNGHLMGDQLLQQFAEVLTESVRNQDIAARYGGEEFAVILPHTNVEEGLVVAEKVRRRVEEANFPGEESQPGSNLTVSVGVADSLGDVKTVEDLTIQADLALYHAKETGRNRSCRFTEDLVSNKKK